jgi:hypothetical protein
VHLYNRSGRFHCVARHVTQWSPAKLSAFSASLRSAMGSPPIWAGVRTKAAASATLSVSTAPRAGLLRLVLASKERSRKLCRVAPAPWFRRNRFFLLRVWVRLHRLTIQVPARMPVESFDVGLN